MSEVLLRMVQVTKASAASTPASNIQPATIKSTYFEDSINALKADAYAFAQRMINDDKVRADYKAKVDAAAKEIIDEVKAGRMTPHEGAKSANALRNNILELSRTKLSDLGLAISEEAKKTGKTLEYLQESYAKKKFQLPFDKLTQEQRNKVWIEICDAAGRGNKNFNLAAKLAGYGGRTLMVFGLAVTVWNVCHEEDKKRAVAKEVTATGGAGMGAAGGAIAVGLLVSNPAGWMVGLAIFVGGACGGILSAEAFDYLIPTHPKR